MHWDAGRLQEDALGGDLRGLQAAVLRRQAEGGVPRHPGSRRGEVATGLVVYTNCTLYNV